MKISRRDNLDRYYLLQLFGYGIFLHKMHHDEEKDIFHNHPWPWFSIILGKYKEQKAGQEIVIQRFINWNNSQTYHRVELFKPTWSIFVHGKRNNKWSVIDSEYNVITTEPWRGVGGVASYRGK